MTDQEKIWPFNLKSEHQYDVKSKILASCIGIYKVPLEIPGVKDFNGFNLNNNSPGYPLLVHFVSLALGIHRLPFRDDSIVFDYRCEEKVENLTKLLISLTENETKNIIDECKAIYTHTQQKLQEAGLKKVRLHRVFNIDDDSENKCNVERAFLRYIEACQYLNQNKITLEMDVLTSYSDRISSYSGSRPDIEIITEVDARNVFYCSNLISSSHHSQDLVEFGEWVVINRAPNGLVDFPISDISITSHRFNNDKVLDQSEAERIIKFNSPFKLKHNHNERQLTPSGVKLNWRTKLAHWLLKS